MHLDLMVSAILSIPEILSGTDFLHLKIISNLSETQTNLQGP